MKFYFSFIFVAYRYLLVLALCDEKIIILALNYTQNFIKKIQCGLDRPLRVCYDCELAVLLGLLTVRAGVSLTLLLALRTFFFPSIRFPCYP